MNNQARRWMQTFFDAVTEPYGDTCWCPHADIYRGTNAWLVKFDLAGVRSEDLSVSVENGLLVVRNAAGCGMSGRSASLFDGDLLQSI